MEGKKVEAGRKMLGDKYEITKSGLEITMKNIAKGYKEDNDALKNPNWDFIIRNVEKTRYIGFRKEFYEMTGNIKASILLNQILYWHRPPKSSLDSSQTRMKVKRDGYLWLAKRRSDWSYICLTPNQYDAASKKLKALGYIETKVSKYLKIKQILIRLTPKFVNEYSKLLKESDLSSFLNA